MLELFLYKPRSCIQPCSKTVIIYFNLQYDFVILLCEIYWSLVPCIAVAAGCPVRSPQLTGSGPRLVSLMGLWRHRTGRKPRRPAPQVYRLRLPPLYSNTHIGLPFLLNNIYRENIKWCVNTIVHRAVKVQFFEEHLIKFAASWPFL